MNAFREDGWAASYKQQVFEAERLLRCYEVEAARQMLGQAEATLTAAVLASAGKGLCIPLDVIEKAEEVRASLAEFEQGKTPKNGVAGCCESCHEAK